jgi:hypothetical protein
MKKTLLFVADVFLLPLTFLSAVYMLFLRKYLIGFFISRAKYNLKLLRKVGVFPLRDHYYEPWFGSIKKRSLKLTGIDFNITGQLDLLDKLIYSSELLIKVNNSSDLLTYSFDEGPFRSGDAEVLYSIVRHFKPKRVVEIGGGHSSKIIQHALVINNDEQSFVADHTCIEPFEAPYLKNLDLTLIKKVVTDVESNVFEELNENDILFIDSSHIIRPDGDVLYQILEIMPLLRPGVIIHVHDIFTPNDYLDAWHNDGVNFWNEQYLLEAFLSCNEKFEIICAVNFLKHNYLSDLRKVALMIDEFREPGSMWIRVKK